jgi:hypothetical protein
MRGIACVSHDSEQRREERELRAEENGENRREHETLATINYIVNYYITEFEIIEPRVCLWLSV